MDNYVYLLAGAAVLMVLVLQFPVNNKGVFLWATWPVFLIPVLVLAVVAAKMLGY